MEMGLVRAVANCPLCPLFDSKEPELTITLARRRLPFPVLRTNPAWGFASSITDEENFLETWYGFLRSSDNYGISNRRAVCEHVLVNSVETRKATAFRRSGHHGTHWCSWHEGSAFNELR